MAETSKQKTAIKDLTEAIDDWTKLRAKSEHEDMSDLEEHELVRVSVRLATAIQRHSPHTSVYHANAAKVVANVGSSSHKTHGPLKGIAQALLDDINNGRLSVD